MATALATSLATSLAGVVVVAHAGFLAFVVFGGFVTRGRTVVLAAHVGSATWAAIHILVDSGCPLTSLEKWLRGLGGEAAYAGGYIEHYVEGLVYPTGWNLPVQLVSVVLVMLPYSLLVQNRVWAARSVPLEFRSCHSAPWSSSSPTPCAAAWSVRSFAGSRPRVSAS